MSAATPGELLERFRDYLEQQDSLAKPVLEETAPVDLYTLFCALEALKNETRIEARQLKSALEEFRAVFDTLREDNARLGRELDQRRQTEPKLRRALEAEIALELIELRDRLGAGLDQVRAHRPSLLVRMFKRERRFRLGLREGMAMSLRRLDELLCRHGIEPIPALDQRHDPHTMHARETENHPGREQGLVVAELRRGYLHHGRLLRTAEVVVNRRQEDS